MSCNSQNIEFCQVVGHVDNLFQEYLLIKDNLLKWLSNPEEGYLSYLPIDDNCQYCLGKGNLHTDFICSQCRSLKRLSDHKELINKPFVIETGKHTGKVLVIRQFPYYEKPFVNVTSEPIERCRLFLAKNPQLFSCGSSFITGSKHLLSDPLSNNIIISWIIEDILQTQIPHYNKLYLAFICHGEAYLLQESVQYQDISQIIDNNNFVVINNSPKAMSETNIVLKKHLVYSIFIQLLVFFHSLKDYDFTYGQVDHKSLRFSKEPCAYIYEGIEIVGPLTVKLNDFSRASISAHNLRIYSSTEIARLQLLRDQFQPKIITMTGVTAACSSPIGLANRELSNKGLVANELANMNDNNPFCQQESFNTYIIDQESITFFSYLRSCGTVLFPGSFDFYCLILLLMSEKILFHTVLQDAELYHFWSLLWLPKDIYIIEQRLTQIHGKYQGNTKISHLDIFDLLKGMQLRCNVVTFLWSLIASGKVANKITS